MNEIKRYDAGTGVNERVNGQYVKFYDHAKEIARLRAENEELAKDAERRLDLIRATVENSEWRHGSRNIYGELKREIQAADAAMENNNV